ncbi:glycoside hydrolase family 16 protein [Capnocytophaga sp.]|uniref:glycoside hydrolase family 16 protein n=1 Tax=Capnocytophaga sp. TaxID=44737 RepID=UPI0026DBB17A|nr:glycoside hydrolase family 16 protein [Capnocytophaga sp.]MDO5105144.1 glycoside hydrolase family 16 protein [Capnocytophaga sp.]
MKNIVIAFCVFIVVISCKSVVNSETKKEKWRLVWEDDFNRDDIFSTGIWSKISRGKSDWNNTMSQHESLFEIKDGNLILIGKTNDIDPKDSSAFVTGGVFTKGGKYFDYGKIEICCKLEVAQGAWPAIWMLPKEEKWPDGGEIDIMERLNFDDFVYQTVHSRYTQTHKEFPKHYTTFPIKSDDYNAYAVEIQPDELRFYVNNQFTFSYPRIEGKPEQFPFGKPFYLLIDMQLGGSWVGEVTDFQEPVRMYVDWVRYYQK